MVVKMNIGLHVYKDGRQVGMPWAEYAQRVLEAASKPRRRNPHAKGRPTTVSLYKKPTPDRQCDFVKKTGQRCGCWAMKGAERCSAHGGYRQNPEHPASFKRLDEILDRAEETKANTTIYTKMNPKSVHLVQETLRAEGLPCRPTLVVEGMHAYELDDNGAAFRRWRTAAIKHQPTTEQRAKRQNDRKGRNK